MSTKELNSNYFASSSRGIIWKVFSEYWWVVLFCALVFCGFSHMMHSKRQELVLLRSIVTDLEEKKFHEIESNEELLAHRASRNDPEYVKLLLMKNLGLVEEGQVKVTFQ